MAERGIDWAHATILRWVQRIEQAHRRIKQRIRLMLGFKRFDYAVVTISGIELTEKIRKGRFKIGKLGGRSAGMPEIRAPALAA